MGKASIAQSVMELIEPVLLANGFELIDVEFKKEGKNWILRIYIDTERGITLADCQQISGLAGDLIEIEGFVKPGYILEVSSPGLNRTLKKEKDFIRFSGKKISVQCHIPLKGKKKLIGLLKSFENQSIYLEVEGQLIAIPLNRIAKANLIVEI